jgi:hypothetical protein
MASELALYEAALKAMSAALAEAKKGNDVKHIKDEAELIRLYAQKAKNRKLEAEALELRHRAERKLGEIMEAQKTSSEGWNKGGGPGRGKTGVTRTLDLSDAPTLKEAGIDKNLAKRARKAAAMSADDFEQAIGVIHQIAKEELGRPLTLSLQTEYSPRRERAQGSGNDRTRLIVAECMVMIRDAVASLKRPVTQLVKNPPIKSDLLPGYMKKLEHYLTLMRTWDDRSQQQSEEVAERTAEQESASTPNAKANTDSERKAVLKKADKRNKHNRRNKANTQQTETVGAK